MTHKTVLKTSLLFLFLSLSALNTQAGELFSMGLMLGDPTGISFAGSANGRNIHSGLAYSYDSRVEVFADFIWENPGAFDRTFRTNTTITPYVGIGPLLRFGHGNNNDSSHANDSFKLGVRIPLGLEWVLNNRFEFFGEFVPGLHVVPSTSALFQLAIGARFRF